MPEEGSTTTVEEVTTTSDGNVKVAIERYEKLLETVADQRSRIGDLNQTITKLRNEPPVVHRTVVQKTAEMVAEDHRVWGATFMGAGTLLFVVGALRYRAGTTS